MSGNDIYAQAMQQLMQPLPEAKGPGLGASIGDAIINALQSYSAARYGTQYQNPVAQRAALERDRQAQLIARIQAQRAATMDAVQIAEAQKRDELNGRKETMAEQQMAQEQQTAAALLEQKQAAAAENQRRWEAEFGLKTNKDAREQQAAELKTTAPSGKPGAAPKTIKLKNGRTLQFDPEQGWIGVPGDELPAPVAKGGGGSKGKAPAPGKEGGSYIPLVDAQGNVLGAWNPKSDNLKENPMPGARKSPVSPAQQDKTNTLEVMREDLDTLEQLGNTNKGSIGTIQGRVSAAKRATIGTSDEVNELFRLSDNYADQLLRARSGAQINEKEFARLRQLAPNPRGPEGKFFTDLNGAKSELDRLLQRRPGTKPLQYQTPDLTGFSAEEIK
jgi:hypothetical protein